VISIDGSRYKAEVKVYDKQEAEEETERKKDRDSESFFFVLSSLDLPYVPQGIKSLKTYRQYSSGSALRRRLFRTSPCRVNLLSAGSA
jgi:hypothetical protein